MELMQQIGGVLGVLGLLGAALWWLRRKGMAQFTPTGVRRKSERSLEVLERLPLTPHHSLHLVRVADRAILIALSPAGCTVLESSHAEARPEVVR